MVTNVPHRYRVAVVGGAGMWGRNYLKASVAHPDCDVILVDSARERRQPFVDHYGIETVYDSVEDLLAAEVPDIAAVILPVDQAPPAVITSAEAGVRALSCEKPIAVQLSLADDMVRVCRERGVAFGCATALWEMPFLPEPRVETRMPCRVSVTCENGQVWLTRPEPVIIRGTGAAATPIRPDFLEEERPRQRSMAAAIERLIKAVDEGAHEVPCSGHDYRQALEIAIGFKLSAAASHARITLPLAERSQRILPHPYRLRGGDVVGWDSIGYESPPHVEHRSRRRR